MKQKHVKLSISWPTATVLVGVVAGLTISWAVAPEHRAEILAALGAGGAALLAAMRPLLEHREGSASDEP